MGSRRRTDAIGLRGGVRRLCRTHRAIKLLQHLIWVVVKIMIPFGVLIIIRHLIFRVPQKGTLILTTTHIGALMFGIGFWGPLYYSYDGERPKTV